MLSNTDTTIFSKGGGKAFWFALKNVISFPFLILFNFILHFLLKQLELYLLFFRLKF